MKSEVMQHLSEAKQLLTAKYGLVMWHFQLADLLNTSSPSLRNRMRNPKSVFFRYLKHYRRRVGRKIVYLTARVAEAIVLSDSELVRRMNDSGKEGLAREE